MAEAIVPPAPLQLQSAPRRQDYLTEVYATLAAFVVIGIAIIGLYWTLRGSASSGLPLFVIAGVLAALAWSMARQERWRYQFATLAHRGGLLIGVLCVVLWFARLISLINADTRIAEAGGALLAIFARLSALPMDMLALGDALIIIVLSLGMAYLLRVIVKADAERRLDNTHISDAENLLRRFFKSTSARVGGAFVVLLLLTVYAIPRVDAYDARIDGDLAMRLAPPDCVIGWFRLQQGLEQWAGPGPRPASVTEYPCTHPFGADKNGRDLMRRVMHGIGVSLAVSVISVSVSLFIGATIGLVAGYLGNWIDSLLMRAMDIMLAFPALLLAIAIVAMRGPGLENAMLAIGIVGIPAYARVARSMAIGLRDQEFVTAARSIGSSQAHILRRHILPNSLAPLIVQSTLGLGTAVIETAALGFLGLGQQPPWPELGKMLAESRDVMTSGNWWVMLFPAIAVIIIVLSFNLLGDALRDALDPRLRGQ